MAKTALRIATTGEVTTLDLDAPEGALAVLQAGVGGWIEPVDLSPNACMYVNEEGKLEGKPVHSFGSHLYDRTYGSGRDIIVGDIVLTGGVDDEGETQGLTPEQAATYTALAEAFYS